MAKAVPFPGMEKENNNKINVKAIPFPDMQMNTEQNISQPVNQPQPQYNDGNIFTDTAKDFAGGSARLFGNIANGARWLGKFVYSAAAQPQNAFAELTGNEQMKVDSSDAFKIPGFNLIEEELDSYSDASNQAAETIFDSKSMESKQLGNNMIESLKEGRFMDFGKQLVSVTAQTAPNILLAMMGGFAGTAAQGLGATSTAGSMLGTSNVLSQALPKAVIGLSAVGGEYRETEGDPELSDQQELLSAGVKGTSEVIWESLVTLPMIDDIVRTNKIAGDQMQKGIEWGLANWLKSGAKGGLSEAGEEMGTEATNYISDVIIKGKQFNADEFTSLVANAGLGAIATGAILSSVGDYRQNNAQNLRYDINQIIKAERMMEDLKREARYERNQKEQRRIEKISRQLNQKKTEMQQQEEMERQRQQSGEATQNAFQGFQGTMAEQKAAAVAKQRILENLINNQQDLNTFTVNIDNNNYAIVRNTNDNILVDVFQGNQRQGTMTAESMEELFTVLANNGYDLSTVTPFETATREQVQQAEIAENQQQAAQNLLSSRQKMINDIVGRINQYGGQVDLSQYDMPTAADDVDTVRQKSLNVLSDLRKQLVEARQNYTPQPQQQENVAQIPIEQQNNADNTIEQENQTDEGLNTQPNIAAEETSQYIQQSNERIENFREIASQENTPGIPEELQSYVIHNGAKFDVIDTNGNTWTYQRIDDAINEARKTRAAIEGQPIQEGQQQQEGIVEDEGQQEKIIKGIRYDSNNRAKVIGFADSIRGVYIQTMKENSEEVASQYQDWGENQHNININPKKPLIVDRYSRENGGIPGRGTPAGIQAARILLDEKNWRKIWNMNSFELDNYLSENYPEVSQEIKNNPDMSIQPLEILGAYLARQEGYDSIITSDENISDPSEALILDSSIIEDTKQAEGKESETATPNNTEIKTKFAVMNADDIQASHDTSLNVNENFPQELQPRDRGKAATQEQIINIVNNLNPKKLGDSYSTATGSPILGPDGYVEVGNGRTIALKTLYEQNHKNAETYKQWLRDNAEQFGLTPEQIDSVENPVLVRIRTSDVEDRVRFVQDANARESASMSASEQAMVDADRITQDLLNKFVPHDDGLINIAANKPFINQFMDQVVGKGEKSEFLDSKGYLNQAGIRKVKNAIFAAAYDDINILAEISESTSSNLKNITGAMMEAAPRMVNVKDQINRGILPDLDISQDLVEAVKLYKTIKNSGKSFDNYFQQQNLFGEDNYTPIQEQLVRMFEDNKRSRKALREILVDYTYRIENAGRADMESMFDVEQANKEDLLRQSVEAVVGKNDVGQDKLFGKEPKNININGKNVKMSNNATDFSQKNKYARSEFTLNDKKIEMPELLDIILALSEGKYPGIIKSLRNTGTLGYYAPKEGQIGLNPDIFVGETIVRERVPVKQFDRRFQEIQTTIANDPDIGEVEYRTSFSKNYVEIRVIRVDPEYAAQTISHELGHLIDFIPRDDFDDGSLMDQMSIIYKGQKDEVLDAIRDSNNLGPRIKTELKRLSMKWKPFDPSDNQEFTKYRFSPEELYADAMSVFFLDLDMLQQEAPLFSQFIQKSISKKPAVKKSYNTVRHLMENRSEMINKTFDNLQEGMVDGVEQTKKKIQRRERGVKSGFDWLIESFIDKNSALYKYFRGEYSDTGEKGKLSREARNKMEEIAYMSSEVEDYLYNIGQIVEGLSNYDIDFLDFNSFLFNKRVLGDRRKYANPLFVNTVRAEEMQQALLDKYGEEKYQKIVNAAEKYYQLRQERIIPIMEKSNMFTEAAMEKVKNNKEYVTFEVVDYINTEFGEGTGDIIMRQYGTGRKISNPLVATMLKDMSIISSIRINESKVAAVKALKKIAPESIRQAPTKEIYGKIIPKDSTDADEGLITFTVNGKLDGYLVEKDIADLYEYTPHKANAATNTILSIVQGMKSIMVSHNPGWMIFNIPRDFFATVMNNPEIGIKDIPALAHEYKKAFSEAWNNVRHNKRSEDISYMRRNRMLTIDRMYRPSDSYMEDDTQQLLTEIFDYNEQSGEEHSRLQKLIPDKVRSAWEGLDNFGQVSEMTGQIAGYRMLKNITNLSEGDLAHRVRTRVGTPDFKQRGAFHSLTNNLFIFSTIRKSGWTAAAESFRQNPGTFLFKVALLSLLPKLLQLGAEEADELFPNSEFAKTIAETMEGVSEYKKETYLVVPVWKANGKAITIQLPQDFIGQAVTSLVYNAARGEWGDVAGTAWTELPWNTSNLNPLLQAAADVQRLTSGENIYDTWRGRNVISEEAMLTGNVGQKLKEFGLYEFFNLGGSAIVNPSIAYADGTLEALSNIIPFNAVKRLISVSESGYYEDVTKVYQDQKKYTQMVANYNNSRRYGEDLRYSRKEIMEAKRNLSQLNKLIRHFANINRQIKYAQSQGKKETVDKLERQKINLARRYNGKEPLSD